MNYILKMIEHHITLLARLILITVALIYLTEIGTYDLLNPVMKISLITILIIYSIIPLVKAGWNKILIIKNLS